MKWLVGIDEVGRGPLAGPVCVGMCVAPFSKSDRVWRIIRNAKDSKQLSSEERNFWKREAEILKLSGKLFYFTSSVSNKHIDEYGISNAIRVAIKNCFRMSKLNPRETDVLLDGSLKAPKEFLRQETIIRGDQSEPIISLASIVAKVRRDNIMIKFSAKFPEYGFDKHKGYGTKDHIKALKINGPCEIHRRSFIGKIVN